MLALTNVSDHKSISRGCQAADRRSAAIVCANGGRVNGPAHPDRGDLPRPPLPAETFTRQDGGVESLADLRVRRAVECRLTPERALGSLAQAEAFLRDRGLL